MRSKDKLLYFLDLNCCVRHVIFFCLKLLMVAVSLAGISSCIAEETLNERSTSLKESAASESSNPITLTEPTDSGDQIAHISDDEVFSLLIDGKYWAWSGYCGKYEFVFDDDGSYIEIETLEDGSTTLGGNVMSSRFLVYSGYLYFIDGRFGRETPVMYKTVNASVDEIQLIHKEGSESVLVLEHCPD